MMFKGTPTWPGGVLDQAISREGAYWNAHTFIDFTGYYETMPADRIDLLAVHGVNNGETFQKTIAPGGPLDVAEELKRQGRAGHIGFSSHGPTDILLEAVQTGRFDYMNLHWYWIFQDNWPAIIEANMKAAVDTTHEYGKKASPAVGRL